MVGGIWTASGLTDCGARKTQINVRRVWETGLDPGARVTSDTRVLFTRALDLKSAGPVEANAVGIGFGDKARFPG